MKFNSQICTTREQSERLLALGLRKETADMMWWSHTVDWCGIINETERQWHLGIGYAEPLDARMERIPAWSLHRLIEMMPDIIKDHIDEMLYHLSIDGNSVFYENRSLDLCQFFGDPLYVCIIDCIEWLIKEGYFNKEYLEE